MLVYCESSSYDTRCRFLPYTTLFRSDQYVIGQEKAKKTLAVAVYNHYKRINSHQGRVDALVVVVDRDGEGLDRKSTRLNSSHTVISYAVFCLKKRKKLIN